MADALYTVGIKIDAMTAGFSGPIRDAMQVLTRFEDALGGADAAAARFGPRLTSSFASMEQAAQRVGVAYDKAAASMAAINNSAALMPEQRAANLASHTRDMEALTAAQAGLSAEAERYNGLLAEREAATMAATTAQRSMMGMLAGGAAFGGGLLGLGFLTDAVSAASDYQTTLTQIQQVLTGGAAEHLAPGARLTPGLQAQAMAAIQRQALSVGEATGQSAQTMAEIIRATERSGMTDINTLLGPQWQRGNYRGGIVPGLATFAQMLNLSRGLSPDESTTIASEFAHLFGVFNNPRSFNTLTEYLGRALMVTPASPSEFLNTSRQLVSTIRPLYGQGTQAQQRLIRDVLTTTALESEAGIGQRGGTELARLITQTLGGGARAPQSNAALREIERVSGVNFFNREGAFVGIGQTMQALAKVSATQTPQEAEHLFQQAFKQVGGRQAGILSTPQMVARLRTLNDMFGPTGLPTTQAAMKQLLATPAGQQYAQQQMWQDIEIQMGTVILPTLLKVEKAFTNIEKAVITFTSHHQDVLRFAGAFTAVATTAGLIGGPIVAAASAMSALGLSSEGFLATLGPAAGALGLLTAGVAAYALLFSDWDDVMKAVYGNMDKLHAKAAALALGLEALFAPILNVVRVWDFLDQHVFGAAKGFSQHGAEAAAPGVPPPHRGDVWKNGQWYLPSGRPDMAGLPQQRAAQLHVHEGAFTTHITVNGHVDEHKVAAAVKKVNQQTLQDMATAWGDLVNYGPTMPYTSNSTLRSGGY